MKPTTRLNCANKLFCFLKHEIHETNSQIKLCKFSSSSSLFFFPLDFQLIASTEYRLAPPVFRIFFFAELCILFRIHLGTKLPCITHLDLYDPPLVVRTGIVLVQEHETK